MMQNLRNLLRRAENWPQAAQEELLRPGLEIEAVQGEVYSATADELSAIDEALEQMARGDLASDEEVEAAFAKFRRA